MYESVIIDTHYADKPLSDTLIVTHNNNCIFLQAAR